MILLLLLLFTATAYAQNCVPADSTVYQSLLGCPSINKREESRVLYPDGHTEHLISEGTGECAQRSSCDQILYTLGLTGTEECWPWFNDAVVSQGKWRRTVINARVAIGSVGTCSQRTGDYIEQVPLFGPKCATGAQTTFKSDWTCATAISGQLPWFNPFYPEPVCSWTYLPGTTYCGDLEPVNK